MKLLFHKLPFVTSVLHLTQRMIFSLCLLHTSGTHWGPIFMTCSLGVPFLSAQQEFQPTQSVAVESYNTYFTMIQLSTVLYTQVCVCLEPLVLLSPVFAVFEMEEATHHGFHPSHTSTQVSCEGKVVVSKCLLKFLCHLVKICKIARSLQVKENVGE